MGRESICMSRLGVLLSVYALQPFFCGMTFMILGFISKSMR